MFPGMVVHQQPNGEVVATITRGSRVLRVVGGRPDRGCAACVELTKTSRWVKLQEVGVHLNEGR